LRRALGFLMKNIIFIIILIFFCNIGCAVYSHKDKGDLVTIFIISEIDSNGNINYEASLNPNKKIPIDLKSEGKLTQSKKQISYELPREYAKEILNDPAKLKLFIESVSKK